MRFTVIVNGIANSGVTPKPELIGGGRQLTSEMLGGGVLVNSVGLRSSPAGARGWLLVTDGPFAETKELIGGM